MSGLVLGKREEVMLADNPGEHATARFEMELGALVRGHVRVEIESLADFHDLRIVIRERRGWLDSTLKVTVSGLAKDILAFSRAVVNFAQQCESE